MWDVLTAEHEVTVRRGETPEAVALRVGSDGDSLRALNRDRDLTRLAPGTALRVVERHVVPTWTRDGLVVDIARRRLYWFDGGALRTQFPVAVGKPGWSTPRGVFRITGRRKDPVWRVPPSIQREMRASGARVLTRVAAGPKNPLGKYFIELSASGVGLHGTNVPSSVGRATTHGCMRLLAENAERLFNDAPDGTTVAIVYEPVKLARDGGGRIWLEVHPDIYGRVRVDVPAVRRRIEGAGLSEAVDWTRVQATTKRAAGVPEDVTRRSPPTRMASSVTPSACPSVAAPSDVSPAF